jgi:N-acetylmuramoyl-L-alanine amidase
MCAALPAHAAPSCDRTRFLVAVDVGHTPEVPGAISARGVPEYSYNGALADEIGRALRAAGFARTQVMRTPGSAGTGLAARIAQANGMRADLFLSVHHDSVPARFLQPWEVDGATWLFSDRFRGHSLFVSKGHRRFADSLRFASLLGAALSAQGLRYTPHYADPIMAERRRELLDASAGVYRFDQLAVLKSTTMPAVLLEAGSIVHRDEELLLRTPEHRAVFGAAVVSAVEGFCRRRGGAGALRGVVERTNERRLVTPAPLGAEAAIYAAWKAAVISSAGLAER